MTQAAQAFDVAVFTGTFDPVTLGHVDIINRGRTLFRRLVVGVGVNPEKTALLSLDERADLLRAVVAPYPNVEVKTFSGLAVRFVREQGARVMLRGVRTLGDIEAEFTMSLANQVLDDGVETVFLMAHEEYSHISSSLIKQIAELAGEDDLRKFVPEAVIAPLMAKIRGRRRG
jgi:pantetheine-phosphate adenylyltransferase